MAMRPDHRKEIIQEKKEVLRKEEDNSLRRDSRNQQEESGAKDQNAPKESAGNGSGGSASSAGSSAGTVAQISVAAVAVVAAVTLGIVEVPGLTGADAKAEIISLLAYDTVIEYVLDIDNPDDKELTVRLFNDYFSEGIPLGSDFRGTFSDLKPESNYTLEVFGNFGLGKKTLASKKVTTTKEAKLEDVNFHRGNDILYFELDLSGGIAFSDIKAVLYSGTDIVCSTEITDPGVRQQLDISGLAGSFRFEITANNALSGGAEEILYIADLTI